MPILIALHPFTGSGNGMARLTGFDALSARDGFLAVYPDGRQRVWNANPSQPSSIVGEPADDVAFIAALIDHLIETYDVDETRIYVVGASSGGLMAHRIAGELTDRVAAAASVMITLPATWSEDISPSGPIPFLMMHGDSDPFFPWEGGVVEEGPTRSFEYWSAADSVGFWVANNSASVEPIVEELPDTDPNDLTTVYRELYAANLGGADVVFYGVRNGGHNWPGSSTAYPEWLVGLTSNDVNASEIIWAFLQNYP